MDGKEKSIIQKLDYSLVLPSEGLKLTIGTRCYDAIMAGRKKYEVRLGYLGMEEYQAGNQIELVAPRASCSVLLESVEKYSDMRKLVKELPWRKIVPHAESLEEAHDFLTNQHPPYKGMPDILVFELEPIKVQIG